MQVSTKKYHAAGRTMIVKIDGFVSLSSIAVAISAEQIVIVQKRWGFHFQRCWIQVGRQYRPLCKGSKMALKFWNKLCISFESHLCQRKDRRLHTGNWSCGQVALLIPSQVQSRLSGSSRLSKLYLRLTRSAFLPSLTPPISFSCSSQAYFLPSPSQKMEAKT